MADAAAPVPHLTAHLFPTLDGRLIDLLRSLTREDWERPFHYRSMSAPSGTCVRIHVSGDCGGDWHLYRRDAWMLASEPVGTIAATVTVPQDIAWRIFTKGIARENAREHVRVAGDPVLAAHVLEMVAIVG